MPELRHAIRHGITIRDPFGDPLPSVWCYDPRDPWALTLEFPTAFPECVCLFGCLCEPIRWQFGRDLLAAGLRGRAGEGDVQVRPHLDRVAIRLQVNDEGGVLTAPATDVERFLATTYAWVPPGEESNHVDVDTVVARLLAGRP